ncbi:MAG: cytochrome c [Chloroflexi bacterium]|nr:cytochrome c [Chloroflexota bacterium]
MSDLTKQVAEMNRFRIRMFLTLMFLGVVATACNANSVPVTFEGDTIDSAVVQEGQQIYLQFCAFCHGSEGQGQFPDDPLMPDETGRYGAPPQNEVGHSWHHDDALLFRYVQQGGMGDPDVFYSMPAFGEQLSDEQIVAVIGYIKTLWTDDQRLYQQQRTDAAD